MRNEIRYKWLFVLLAASLVLMVVAVQVRLQMALPYVPLTPGTSANASGSDPESNTVSGISGTIATRDGEVVFDGVHTKYPAFYAVVGNVTDNLSATHLSHHTLGHKYRDLLAATELTVWGGLKEFEGLSGCEMTTTLLSGAAHQTLYEAFGEYRGCLVAYDYLTGEVLAVVSVPCGQSGTEDDGHLTNRVLTPYAPGSTMKIITAICALTQNPELQNFTYTCTGSHTLSRGGEITCGAAHSGPLTLSDAIGRSCNCYYAALVEQLNVDKTCDILEGMGFNTTDSESATDTVDKLTYYKGYSTFSSTSSKDEVWKLIGPGSMVNLIDMARIAGAVVNGGKSADPYIVQSIYDPNEESYILEAGAAPTTALVNSAVAENLSGIWSEAVSDYYYHMKTPLDRRITHAKTGTSEQKDANGEEFNNRLLLGVMEEEHVAFMLAVEHLPSSSSKIISIANTLAQVIDEANR